MENYNYTKIKHRKLKSTFHFTDNTIYELPDKNNVVVGPESFEIPEALFGSTAHNFPGIHQMLLKCCELLATDNIRDPVSSIILVGGTTNTKSFFERLQNEIYELNIDLFDSCKTRFYFCNAKIERTCSNWTSASIIASMKSFESMMVTRQEYEEHGFGLIERKLM